MSSLRCALAFSALLQVVVFIDISTTAHLGTKDRRFILEFVNYEWGPWGPYVGCSNPNCEQNVKERNRTCYLNQQTVADDGMCGGIGADLARCTPSDCIGIAPSVCDDLSSQCRLDLCSQPWGQINCNRTCGKCITSYPTPAMKINGQWSSWGIYTPCSTTCGDGIKNRYRVCNNPPPSNGGSQCVGITKQTFPCNEGACIPVINGQWGSWSTYSPCSTTCDTGVETRIRNCDNPPASGGGIPCVGKNVATFPCIVKPCDINGQWGMWADWSACSVSCNLGTLTRTRVCDDPVPVGNGTDCTGSGTETHECSLGPCAEWTHWFEGKCSVSCGSGTAERIRHCSTGRDIDCPGSAYSVVPCTNPVCI